MEEQQVRLALSQTTGIECSNCNGVFFKGTTILRKLSKLYSGAPNDTVIPIQAFRCDDCGEILKDFFPEGMADLEAKLGFNKVDSLIVK